MKARKQLRPPSNWPDFEDLCKKLWGEIWQCAEITKNGRSGQSQNGVDVSGIPKGEKQYFGIQCKGKDNYSDSNLSEKEIDDEIKKAKSFEPPLKKFYFATTAKKDSKIEAYVRKKNLEHIESGLFEVHLFSWDDISDKILENKKTYDYYVRSIDFEKQYEVKFVFENDKNELVVEVPFKRVTTHYRQRIVPNKDRLVGDSNILFSQLGLPKSPLSSPFSTVNKSFCIFFFRLHNIGKEPLKNYKIFLNFNGNFESIKTCTKGHYLLPSIEVEYDTYIWNEDKQGKIIPKEKILVPDDISAFDSICIKPIKEESVIDVQWKLVSQEYQTEGDLKLTIKPIFIDEERTELVINPLDKKTTIEIEDHILDSSETE